MPIVEISLENNIPSFFYVLEHIVVFLMDSDQNPISTPLLTVKLETLAPSWAIFDAPTHSTSIPT
jgi:hypothetical protein